MVAKRFASMALSVLLVCSFAFPTTAFATVDEETKVVTEEEAAAALESGVDGMPSTEESLADTSSETGNSSTEEELSAMSLDELTTLSNRTIRLASYSGDTRYDTAVAVARAAYPNGVASATAIVVSGEETAWPDALSASSLAGLIDCPILYTNQTSLNASTLSALSSLGVNKVIIVGGESVVSADVANALESSSYSVIRLSGDNRYDTQLAVYDYGASVGTWSNSVIVASGAGYADALSASSIAFSQKMPIFLSDGDNLLTDGQVSTLASSNVSSFTIVGGTASVNEDMEGFLIGVLAKATGFYEGSAVNRLSGNDRYETSWAIANWGVNSGYLQWNNTGLANGDSSVDALCASSLQGKAAAPILLISNDNLTAVDNLKSSTPYTTRIFGGTGVVSALTRNSIALTLGYPLSSIQGFKVYVDAGHGQNNTGNGAYDSGATGSGYQEASLTAELAGMIASQLRSDGIEVFLNDDGGPYYYRHSEAVAQGCNVVISVHFNSSTSSRATGCETLYHSSNAHAYSYSVASTMQSYLVSGVGLSNRGVKAQAVSILSGSLPAALLEVAFISNSSDMSTYQARKSYVASQIVEGIENI